MQSGRQRVYTPRQQRFKGSDAHVEVSRKAENELGNDLLRELSGPVHIVSARDDG